MTVTDDETLLAGLRAGRPDAARALYASYGAGVYAFAHRRTSDPDLSREIVQDVMLSVWRAAPRFDDDRGNLRSWVFQIARNATIDAGRRRRSRPSLVAFGAVAEQCASAPDDIDRLFRNWMIMSAMDRLPEEHRAVMELVYLQQRKVAEAAVILGVPEGTIKSRCFYALKNLRSSFDEMGVISSDL